MGLSNELLTAFAKITKDNTNTKKETSVNGTVKEYNGKMYVQLDGSDLLTPATTTADLKNGERVVVQIKDHSATIIGNTSSPSASSDDVVAANTVITNELQAESARITELITDNVKINERLTVSEADIEKLQADIINTANLEAINAEISNLKTTKLDASSADIKYANIDFTNINMTSVEKLFTKSGIIKDLVVGDTSITGELVGVTIKGDLIQGNTIVADKLVVQGEDGLYYKLNTDGIKIEAEQTDYNSLNGSIITTKSITASKIDVHDLVAFGATIGGFKLTENSIYSGVKTSVDNTTNGVYLDNEGQMSIGDSDNFIKYYKDQNGNYKLEISSESITASINNLQSQIDRINERI